jgi:hypothetical protein
VDRLGSSTSHSYAQTWHLAPNASLRVSGQDVTVHAAGVPVLAIRQANQSGMTLATIKGQTSPALQGWYSSSYGSKVPAWALEYRRSAPSVAFATLLAASPYASQPATVTRTPIGRGNRIDLCVNRTIGYSVTVPAAGSPVTVTGGGCR